MLQGAQMLRSRQALIVATLLGEVACHRQGEARADSAVTAAAAPPAAAAPARADAARPAGKVVLSTTPVPGRAGRSFELSIGACQGARCPVLISLLDAGNVLDEEVLPWPSATREAAEQPAEAGWGARDPMDHATRVKAWVTGEEATFLATMVRPLSLAPGTGGVLVSQIAGFEHLKRAHVVFVAVGQELVKAWAVQEGAGWTFSAAAPIQLAPERDGVVYFERFDHSLDSDTEPDTLTAEILGWDAMKRRLVPVPAQKGRLAAVVVGPFANVREAKQRRAQNRDCLAGLWILPASRFGLGPRGVVLARPTSQRAAAKRLSAETVACAPGQKVVVAALR
jgi:hypothetical protein